MRLTGIDCQVPSIKVTNEDVIELILFYSAGHFEGSLEELETLVRRFMKLTGIRTRFWRREKEMPTELIQIAAHRALKMAGLVKKEIQVLIYSGIDRAFIEPANASFISKLLGIRCRSFDIVDGCMGWSTSVQTAYSYFRADRSINHIMVVNSEFPMDKNGVILPNNFTINGIKELGWKSPSFTLGEGTSVSIFSRDDHLKQEFIFWEAPESAHLCSIPLINFEKLLTEPLVGQKDMQFYANGAELLENGMAPSIEVLKLLLAKLNYIPKLLFPHSVSEKIIQEALANSGVTVKPYSTFADLGNLATVSIPSAITKAVLNNCISKGDKCIGWVASAGMKFSAIEVSL